jgi:hypothetical protein
MRTIEQALAPYRARFVPMSMGPWPCTEGHSFEDCHNAAFRRVHLGCDGSGLDYLEWERKVEAHIATYWSQDQARSVDYAAQGDFGTEAAFVEY